MTTSSQAPAGRTLRVAIVGTGKMGINHVRALRGCTGARLVAVSDPNADRTQLAEYLTPDVEVLHDVEAMLAGVRPDVVHIVTPPHTHAELARAALLGGAHVYVEKPFTPTRHEAEMLARLAAERGLQICAGHQCLFDHASVEARRRLAEIGDVVQVDSYFSFRTVRKSITPVDQAMDILPHAVYMLLDFLRAGGADEPLAIDGMRVTADGTVNGIFSVGARRGVLTVSLRARPVEQYVQVKGTNGTLRVDLVAGAVVVLPGAGANIGGALVNPFRQARQTMGGSLAGFIRHIRERGYGYPGLRTLFQAFYEGIGARSAPAMTPREIVETVGVCEEVGRGFARESAEEERAARSALLNAEEELPPVDSRRGIVLVTGAGGFLGRRTVAELRMRGWQVRAVTRRPPRFVDRAPGVEYCECDLAAGIPKPVMAGVSAIVHCAAETVGGKAAHERNSIQATRVLVEAAARSGVRRFVHVSSLAVLRSAAGVLDEATPIDARLERGPYAWGKAEAEVQLRELGQRLDVGVRVIRPGPLVDFAALVPPGRLGREVGPWFVAIGPRRSRMPLIDVGKAAKVLAVAVEQFEQVPDLVNLVDPASPTRAELVNRFRAGRPDLAVVWIPLGLLKLANPFLKLAQRLLLGSKQPLDVAGAFDAVSYDTRLAGELITRSESVPPLAQPVSAAVEA